MPRSAVGSIRITAGRTGATGSTKTEWPVVTVWPGRWECGREQRDVLGRGPAPPLAAGAAPLPVVHDVSRPRRAATGTRRAMALVGAALRPGTLPARRLPRRSGGAARRGGAPHGRRADGHATHRADPAAHAPAVLRILFQSREFLLLLRSLGVHRRDDPDGDH